MGFVRGSGFTGSLARGRLAAGAAACLSLASLLATCKVDKLTTTPPPVAKLAVAPGQIRDSAAHGSTAIVADSVAVSNAGQGTLSWSHAFTLGGPWLTASADGGVAPGRLRVGFNPAGLVTGMYRDTIVITAENADNSPARIPIEFAVHPCALTAIAPDVVVHDSVTTRDCAAPHHAPSFARAYTFSARANDSISVVMTASGLASYVALDTSLAAAAPALTQGNACGAACIYYRPLPTSGTYEIEAGAGPGQTGPFTLSVTHPRAPNVPGSLLQLRSDSTTSVAPGASIDQSSIVLRAVLTDPDSWDTLALDVEVEPAATPFTGTASATSARVASGVRAYVALAGLANNTVFHWQARTRDQTGRVSAWTPFGTGGSGAADFATAVPTPPNPPTALAQLQGDGVTPIPVGGTARTRSVVFRAAVSDPDPGDQLRLDVEVEPLGTAFTGVPSGSGATVANGGTATATIAGLSDNVSYHWQARAVDQTNLTGPWVALGGAPDFKVAVTASQLAFTVPPSNSTAGAAIAPAVQVAAQDAFGNVVTSFTGTVTMTLGANPGGGTLSGHTSVAALNGVATFSDLSVDKASTGYTLQATAAGLTVVGGGFTVAPAPAAKLVFTGEPPATVTAGAPMAPAVQVTARDAFGNTASGFTGAVTVAIATNPASGTLTGGGPATAVAGVASFGNMRIDKAGSSYALSASAAGLPAATSTAFSVVAGAAAKLAIVTEPPATAQSGVALVVQPALELEDANGNPVSQAGVVVTASIATGPAGATLAGATATTTGAGVATFSGLAITGPVGDYAFSFAAPGVTAAPSTSVALGAGSATHLAITTPPSTSGQSGVALARQPVLQVEDASGNPVSQSGAVITATIATGPAGAILTNATATTGPGGAATFAGLTLSGPVGSYTVSFGATGLAAATSGAMTLNAGAASKLALSTPPSNSAQSGVAFAQQPVIQVQDASGNAVSQNGAVITATVATGPTGATLTNASAATGASGAATFSGLAVSGSVGSYTVSFGATGLAAAMSGTISLSAGPAATLAANSVTSQSATVGTAVSAPPAVIVKDGSGNPVSGVAVTFAVTAGGGTVNAASPVLTNASGVAAVTSWALGSTAGTNTLTATAGTLTGSPVTFTATGTAGAAKKVALTTPPSSSAQSGVAFAQQPLAQLQDSSGNPVSQSGAVITATIAAGPNGAILTNTTAPTGPSGAATFSGLTLSGSTGSYVVSFGAAGLTAASSGAITLAAGPAAKLVLTSPPSSSAQSGVAFAQQPTVQLQDASGNPVSQSGTVVTATIGTGPGGATLTSVSATTGPSGAATFSALALSGPVGSYTLSFGATGLTAASSGTIVLSAGPAAALALTTPPSSSAQNGVAFAQQPVVQLQDASGNPVSQSGTVITATIAGPGGATLTNGTATTGASGAATFSGLTLSGLVGSYTLSFGATGLTAATSGSISLSAGAATKLALTTTPSSSGQSGVPFAQQPVVQLQDASGNPVSQNGTVVTATIATGPGGATLTNATATTGANGAATFSAFTLSGPVGSYTLSFGATGLTAATSGAITLTAGAATKLALTTLPSSSGQSGVAFAQQPVIQLQDANGNPVSQSGTVVTTTIATGPAGGSLTNATATTGANGAATFSGLTLSGSVGSYTLSFGATGFTTVTSGAITLAAGAATKLALTTAPSSSAQSGVAFAQQPVLQLQDASGNPVSQSGTVVTATIATGLGGATLSNATATTAVNGAATFSALTLSGPVGSYTLSFGATGLTAVTSGAINLGAGAATKLALTTAPSSSAQSGVAFAQQPVLQLQDASGNPVGQSGTVITATIATGPGGATLTNGTATTAVSGAATFSALALSGPVGSYTLSFGATGLTAATSGTITLSAGPAVALSVTTPPTSSAQNGVALAQQPVVQMQDASGNAVSQSGTVVTATIATGPTGATLSNASATTGANGAATFSGLTLSGSVGSYTLSFGATGLTAATSGTINLSAGPASTLAANSVTSQSATVGAAVGAPPTVIAKDASGNPVSGVAVTFAVTGGGGTVSPTTAVLTSASGVAAATSWTLGSTAGTNTLTATAGTLSGSPVTFTATGTAGAATKVALTTPPSSGAQSGVALAQQPVVQLQDASGNPVNQSGTVVTATIATGPGGGSLTNATATTGANGAATFSGLAISGSVGSYTLSFGATGLTAATSGTITVAAGAAAKLAFTTTPSSSAQNGVAFAQQPVVQLQDASGNPVSQSGTVITAAIATGPGGATLTNGTATTGASGAATFSGLTLSGPVGSYTLSFGATGLTAATSGTIVLSAGPAATLGLTTAPSSSAQSGVAFAQQPVIQIQDASGNPVSQSGTVITATIATGPGGATLANATAATAVSGAATFSGLAISGSVGSYTLSFGATGLTAVTSGTITLAAGAAAKLALTTAPSSSAQSGVAFAQQPVVQLQDASGNPVSQSGTAITATIASGPGGATLANATATTAVSGAATFSGLTLSGVVGSYTLSFGATGLTAATSGTITVAAGAAAKLALTTAPSSSAQSGVPFAQQPMVQLQDASGNAVSQSGTMVTATIATGPAGGSLTNATATTGANGAATFSGLALSGVVGSYTLSVGATGLTAATSGTITLSAGAATKLALATAPSSNAQSGVAFAQQPVLQLQDASGNPVSQSGTVVTATIATGPGGATLTNATATTGVSGAATFSALTLSGSVGSYTLSFGATGLTAATPGTITLGAGAAAKLAVTTAPSSSAQSGVVFAQQPVLQLQDASGNAVSQSGTVITATIATGPGGAILTNATATTGANGAATFSGLTLTGPVGSYTLSFGATGLTGATSGTITLSAGVATKLAFTVQPTQTAANATITPAVQVAVEDGFGNVVTTFAGSLTIAIGTDGSPLKNAVLHGTLTVAAVNGVSTFGNLSIDQLGTGYTLVASGTALTSATSQAFNIL